MQNSFNLTLYMITSGTRNSTVVVLGVKFMTQKMHHYPSCSMDGGMGDCNPKIQFLKIIILIFFCILHMSVWHSTLSN